MTKLTGDIETLDAAISNFKERIVELNQAMVLRTQSLKPEIRKETQFDGLQLVTMFMDLLNTTCSIEEELLGANAAIAYHQEHPNGGKVDISPFLEDASKLIKEDMRAVMKGQLHEIAFDPEAKERLAPVSNEVKATLESLKKVIDEMNDFFPDLKSLQISYSTLQKIYTEYAGPASRSPAA